MRPYPFTKIFLPLRLVLGVALVLVGCAILAFVFLFLERITVMAVAAGPLFVLLGVAMAVASSAEACRACRQLLEETCMLLPMELDGAARAAVDAAERGMPEAVVALHTAPLTQAHASLTSSIELTYCPSCRQCGRLSAAHRRNRNGFSSAESPSRPVVLTGWPVSAILQAVTVRNEAWTRAVYGGALPRGS